MINTKDGSRMYLSVLSVTCLSTTKMRSGGSWLCTNYMGLLLILKVSVGERGVCSQNAQGAVKREPERDYIFFCKTNVENEF